MGGRLWWSNLDARRRRREAQALSRAVEELPSITRRAMLAALETDELIVGAYTDRRGRVCPMLAAHRRGARTDVGKFPNAWDAFARAGRPRPASRRELEILKALLEESLSDRDQERVTPRATSNPLGGHSSAASSRAGDRARAHSGSPRHGDAE